MFIILHHPITLPLPLTAVGHCTRDGHHHPDRLLIMVILQVQVPKDPRHQVLIMVLQDLHQPDQIILIALQDLHEAVQVLVIVALKDTAVSHVAAGADQPYV